MTMQIILMLTYFNHSSKINNNQYSFVFLFYLIIPEFPPPLHTLADPSMSATLVNRDEKEMERGNKGLMSLAEGGWRLRQMAWSLRHSGVARLVLKSFSLTFQQILPGGWGVCHTTPMIGTAVRPLHPAATTPTSPKKNPPLSLSPTEPPDQLSCFCSHMYTFTH